MAKRIQLHQWVKQAERWGHRQPVRVRRSMLENIYDSINRAVFGGTLKRPRIILRHTKEYWGEIEVGHRVNQHGPRHTYCIRVAREFPNMKMVINTMAHEMVHQWEWERNNNPTHGRDFYAWNERLADRGLRL